MVEQQKCTDCGLWRTSQVSNGLYSCNKLMGDGLKPSDIMFVTTYPVEEDIKKRKPLSGQEGQLVKKYMGTVGINNAYFTCLVKCKPEQGKTPTTPEIEACSKYLIEEIKEVKPKVIVALGSAVMKFFGIDGKISQVRGQHVFNETYGCYILPTYSPAYLNNFVDASRQRKEFVIDLAKTLKIVNGEQEAQLEVKYRHANTIEDVIEFKKELLNAEWFSVDTETDSLDYLVGKVLMLSFSTKEGTGMVIPYAYPRLDLDVWMEQVKPHLHEILTSPVKKIFQNGKFDIQMLLTAGLPVGKFAFDTMLAHFLLDENSPHGLDKIVPIYTDMGNYKDEAGKYIKGEVDILLPGVFQIKKDCFRWISEDETEEVALANKYFKSKSKAGRYVLVEDKIRKKLYVTEAYRKSTIFDCPYDVLVHYAAQDADATFRLFKKFMVLLEQEGLIKLLAKIMVPLSYVLARMEYTGIGGDFNYATKTAAKLKAETDLAKANILASKEVAKYKEKYQTKDDFNPNSYKQKGELFFDIMGLVPLKYNKPTVKQKAKGMKRGNPSTDAEALKLLLENNKVQLLENFIKIGQLKKSQEYLQDYANILSTTKDGRIHTSFNQMGTVTGRLSSKGPNLQNIPSHDPVKAKLIRTVFVARPGYTFIEADYSQIEFRIWAHVSGDKKLLEFINTPDSDIHKLIASQAFKIPIENVTKELRTVAKQTVYGMIYGRSTWSIAQEYGMDEDEVNRFVNGFFKAFPQATQYIENTIALMEKQGYITNLFNRRRRALNIYSKDKKEKAEAQRQARNFPLQSGAADLIYVAMSKVYRALLDYDAYMEVQIHDSIIVEIKDEQLNEVIQIVKKTMEEAIPLKCRIDVDIEAGKCLGEMKDI